MGVRFCPGARDRLEWPGSRLRGRDVQRIRILLADDHVLVREGTRELLEREPDLEVVAEADDGQQAVHLAAELKPDVAVLDAAMPGVNGVEAARQIKAVCPATAVLILSAYDSDAYLFAALEAGATGYLLKSSPHWKVVYSGNISTLLERVAGALGSGTDEIYKQSRAW